MFFTTLETEGEGWAPVKLAWAPSNILLAVPIIVVLFVKRFVVFHLQMFFFLLTIM